MGKLSAQVLLSIIFYSLLTGLLFCQNANLLIPISSDDRTSIGSVRLTMIGDFGLIRKAREDVPEHLHTGIDIKRPTNNYSDEPIFPIAPGVVLSMRNDGPYSQIIIEHRFDDGKLWTVYEHVAGIRISVRDSVNPLVPIARFMNLNELDQFGWQFDHVHFEILKVAPRPLKPSEETPHRIFGVYNLECYTRSDLNRYYFDPMEFFERYINEKAE